MSLYSDNNCSRYNQKQFLQHVKREIPSCNSKGNICNLLPWTQRLRLECRRRMPHNITLSAQERRQLAAFLIQIRLPPSTLHSPSSPIRTAALDLEFLPSSATPSTNHNKFGFVDPSNLTFWWCSLCHGGQSGDSMSQVLTLWCRWEASMDGGRRG